MKVTEITSAQAPLHCVDEKVIGRRLMGIPGLAGVKTHPKPA